MLKNDFNLRNPLSLMGYPEDILTKGGFGAILARAGVGKTAFLVQLALYSQLQNKNVLHISLNDPVKKLCLWYEEVFRNMTAQHKVVQSDQLWESILSHRFIMTFKVDNFSVPRLDERLTDLTEQNIFRPDMILIDGLPFDEDINDILYALKNLAKNSGLSFWFTAKISRDEISESNTLPARFSEIENFFEAVIQLQPEGKDIYVRALKGTEDFEHPGLILDPTTMLIKDKD
ncbi:Cytoplasmic protein [Candidatus Magnetomoraceae bacterium gMMP-15]